MIIMDRQGYINKANNLLNQNTYRSIPGDPINTIKNKLISILKGVKNQIWLDRNTYMSMYPTGCVSSKFYGLPKICKPDTPLRPIVSSCGSVTYGVAKELAKILKPLVGKSPHHINSNQDFVEQVKHITMAPGKSLSSYDVSALFTSVPIDPALNIIKDLLEKDHTLKERTVLAVSDIILLLEFYLKNTYFSFQDQFYEQVEDAAMASPVSSIVANCYMEYLEQKALSTAPTPQVLAQVCGWHLCHPQGSQQARLPTTHHQCWPSHKVYRRTTRRKGPSPFWTPLLNLRLMAHYLSLCTGNLHILTSTCSGIVTITSQPNLVSSTLSPIGPQQCVGSLSCSNRKRTTSGRLSPNANILNGLWTRWRKDSIGLSVRSLMGLTTKALQLPNPVPMKFKIRVTFSYSTHKAFVKASKRSVVDMAFKPTSKVAGPSRASWSPPRTKTLWSTKVVPYIGTNVVTEVVMMNT